MKNPFLDGSEPDFLCVCRSYINDDDSPESDNYGFYIPKLYPQIHCNLISARYTYYNNNWEISVYDVKYLTAELFDVFLKTLNAAKEIVEKSGKNLSFKISNDKEMSEYHNSFSKFGRILELIDRHGKEEICAVCNHELSNHINGDFGWCCPDKFDKRGWLMTWRKTFFSPKEENKLIQEKALEIIEKITDKNLLNKVWYYEGNKVITDKDELVMVCESNEMAKAVTDEVHR